MVKTRRLLREEITYSTAKEREVNILRRLDYYDQQTRFFNLLDNNRHWIKSVVTQHLGLDAARSVDFCCVAEVEDWFHGSFNVCIPVMVKDETWKQKKKQPGQCVLLRLPLPYRIGEAFQPGNSDEKVRCEAGTYAWLQENCPDVPIPYMYGFAMSTGETFTRLEHLPFLSRCFHSIRRQFLSWFNFPAPSYYVPHQGAVHNVVGTGYLVIEYIEETRGRMLSDTWFKNRHDVRLRTNFFRDLSRVFLSICRIPLLQIGSFIINNDGFLCLANRPLSVEIAELENDAIPTNIPRHYTYSTTDSFAVDILALHDSRLLNQPNAVTDLSDSISQITALTVMRTIFPLFFRRDFRRGPFCLNLTDLHQSNIFVDEDWYITCLVDLEWACSHPIEMITPPYWLSGKTIDEVDPENYNETRKDFMNILAAEEMQSAVNKPPAPQLTDVMNQSWDTGTFWRIKPLFFEHTVDDIATVMFYWAKNGPLVAHQKVSDKKGYDVQLEEAFGDVFTPE